MGNRNASHKRYINFKIDTGADATVISEEEDLQNLDLSQANLKPTRKRLTGRTNQRLQCLGYVMTNFWWDTKSNSLYL